MVKIIDHPIIKHLLSLNLPSEDYVIFGSGPLFAHGLIHLWHDVDVVCRGKAWEKVQTLAEPELSFFGDKMVKFLDGKLEIYDRWRPGEWDTDELIEGADIIEGIRFVNLETEIKWLKIMGRPKDNVHILLAKEYLEKKYKR